MFNSCHTLSALTYSLYNVINYFTAQMAFKNWTKWEWKWVGIGTNDLGKHGMGISCNNGNGN
jgi:hypothetical protein